ncbi:MAG TPA: nucleoside-triphosphatase [Spirochaetota bacterium]|nr:nucleoside-triphosphatase [Spirochaetota bacterium]HPJ33311.1 nucleoside-triphosphatase [Spirochaetota bacterium]
MINIICGEINQGKTAKINSIYAEQRNGDGFISKKIFRESDFQGYEITRLSTGETVPLSLKTGLFPPDKIPLYTCGTFSFYEEGFVFADSIIDDILRNNISPVFIDEIGPLELEGKGFCNSLKKIINTERTIYFTVRAHCLDRVISHFSIKEYTLIKI